jgi:hypothetical protein
LVKSAEAVQVAALGRLGQNRIRLFQRLDSHAQLTDFTGVLISVHQ